LVTQNALEANGSDDPGRNNIVVRSPTLLETTPVFAPNEAARSPPYSLDDEQVLRRVRDHTHIGNKNAGIETNVAAVGDPTKTPFAIFGLPAPPKPEALVRYLDFSRFMSTSLDAVIVDVTRTGRSEILTIGKHVFQLFFRCFPACRVGGHRS
jgi:hypothetical protein